MHLLAGFENEHEDDGFGGISELDTDGCEHPGIPLSLPKGVEAEEAVLSEVQEAPEEHDSTVASDAQDDVENGGDEDEALGASCDASAERRARRLSRSTVR